MTGFIMYIQLSFTVHLDGHNKSVQDAIIGEIQDKGSEKSPAENKCALLT